MITGKFIPTELYPQILAKFPYGVVICNSEGKFLYWNQEALQILKTTKLDLPQSNWVDGYGIFTVDKTRKLETEELPMSMALKGVFSTKNVFLQNEENPDGVYLKIKGYPVFDDDEGRLQLGVIIIEDISFEQKKFDDFLKTINELSDFIRDQISDGKDYAAQHKLDAINRLSSAEWKK